MPNGSSGQTRRIVLSLKNGAKYREKDKEGLLKGRVLWAINNSRHRYKIVGTIFPILSRLEVNRDS